MADQRYLVTARKYRPTRFSELVAQEHVSDTLKNALRLDRLAHAYLFSGPRGVGKTTTARILAKAINCETPLEKRDDGAEPCRACDSCESFEAGRSLNVFEMDAASNNKVDDIRELREKVRIPPQGSSRKVYILDEVHMLSKQAFNALLKTLEEPPPHALFIFATTEPHKVLATILSRCQRFDFRRIPPRETVSHLRSICEEEGIEADEKSLMLIARKGNGALRDALSAFDQAISLCGTTLTYSELTQALGVVDQDLYFRLTQFIRERDTGGVLKLVHHVVRNGYDVQEFLAGVAEHLRNLLVARSLGADALEDVADSTRQRYAKGAQAFREADLLRLLTLAGDAEESVKSSAQPRLKVEMTLLKMAQIRRTADLERVLQKLKRLEKMVETGELPERLPDAAPPSESSSGDAGAPADGADASAPADGFAPADASPSEPSASEEHPSSPPASSGSASSGSASSGSASSASAAQRPDEASRPEQAPSPEEATRSASILPSEDVSDTESAATGPSASASAASSLGDDAESQAQEAEASGGDADARDADARDADARDADARDADARDADDSPSPDETPDADLPPASEDTPDDRPPDGGDASSGQGLTYDLFGTPALQQSASDAEGSDPDGSNTTPPDDPPTASAPRASSGPPSVGGRHAASAQASAATAAPPRTLSEAEWERFVEVVRSRSRRLWGTLSDATPKTIEDDVFTIAVAQRFARDQLRDRASVLRECLHAATDVNVDQLHIVVEASEASSASSAAATRDPREHIRALRDTYDALDVLFEEFGAEPTW